jgi:elongation factor G
VVEHDEALMEKYLAGEELSIDEIRRRSAGDVRDGSSSPILCGASFKNKGVQALLDAVIDYLPAPIDVPAIQGHLPHHDETFIDAPIKDDAPFAALAFKIATDPFVGKLTFFRVYSGVLQLGQLRVQQHEGQARACGASAADARQQA